MNMMIACCGLNCEACDAYIATVRDDDSLRKETAEKWRTLYNVPGITPEMINCTGCRVEGVKIAHCYECNIRNCVKEKGYNTCGDCTEVDTCQIVAPVLQHVPEARQNLRSLS